MKSQYKKYKRQRTADRAEYWFQCLLIVLVLVGGIFGIAFGQNLMERSECYGWQRESLSRPGYYLTHWQAEQCQAHNIKINAPVER